MATFLTRDGITESLHRIIREANEELVLISPYIHLDDQTRGLLKSAAGGTRVHVVSKKSKATRREIPFIEELGIEISFVPHLHAKCYMNEKDALITSANLQETSLYRNPEMGILVSKLEDATLYRNIYEEARRLMGSQAASVGADTDETVQAKDASRAKPTDGDGKPPRQGFCISCGDEVRVRTKLRLRPYCRDCYYDLDEGDPGTAGQCHTCGREWHTTMEKPLCLECYWEYKDELQFPPPATAG